MKGRAALLAASLAAALVPLVPGRHPSSGAGPTFPGWPAELAGVPALPLPEAEARRLVGFPGRMARFRLPGQELVLAWVHTPTRRLHPADDCFRGAGYALEPRPLVRDPAGRLWSARRATRPGETLLVTERIEAADGGSFSDVSSWYWAALLGTSRGPWLHWRVAAVEAPGPAPDAGPPAGPALSPPGPRPPGGVPP